MKARRVVEEFTGYLNSIRQFAAGPAFADERWRARREFFGPCDEAGESPDEADRSEGPAAEAAETQESTVTRTTAYEPDQPSREDLPMADEDGAYYDWFVFDRCHSQQHHTPVRLFVDQHPELPERIRRNLLGFEHGRYSTFSVIEGKPDCWVLLDVDGDDTDYYRVIRPDDDLPGLLPDLLPDLQPGDLLRARLVRWDGDWFFAGRVEPWPASLDELHESLQRSGRSRSRDSRRDSRSDPRADLSVRRPETGTNYATRTRWLRDRRGRP